MHVTCLVGYGSMSRMRLCQLMRQTTGERRRIEGVRETEVSLCCSVAACRYIALAMSVVAVG